MDDSLGQHHRRQSGVVLNTPVGGGRGEKVRIFLSSILSRNITVKIFYIAQINWRWTVRFNFISFCRMCPHLANQTDQSNCNNSVKWYVSLNKSKQRVKMVLAECFKD